MACPKREDKTTGRTGIGTIEALVISLVPYFCRQTGSRQAMDSGKDRYRCQKYRGKRTVKKSRWGFTHLERQTRARGPSGEMKRRSSADSKTPRMRNEASRMGLAKSGEIRRNKRKWWKREDERCGKAGCDGCEYPFVAACEVRSNDSSRHRRRGQQGRWTDGQDNLCLHK